MVDPSTPEAERIRSYFGEASWRPSAGREALVAERRRLVERLVHEKLPPLAELAVCDVGCGTGSDLARWRALGVPEERLSGTELVAARAEAARRSIPRGTVARVDGFQLPFPDGSFDLVTASLVVSTIRNRADRHRLATEMARVTRAGGLLAIYDFRIRKPWNRNVIAVSGSELAEALGPPGATYRLAPFLPLLDLAFKLPRGLREPAMRLLPRTHRLWVWERAGNARTDDRAAT